MSCLSHLPKLDEIDFSISTPYLTDEDERNMKMTVRNLLECCRDLKKITAKTVDDLALYLEEVYGLLQLLEFRFRDIDDVSLYRKIIEKGPAIKELVLSTCKPTSYRLFHDSRSYDGYDSDQIGTDADDEDSFERNFHNILELFLVNCCSQSLKKMEIRWGYDWDYGLSFPPLVNLRKLTYTNHFDGDFQGLWSVIVSMDYDQNMPNLEQLKIALNTVDRGNGIEVMESAYVPWPDVQEPDLHPQRPCCTSRTSWTQINRQIQA